MAFQIKRKGPVGAAVHVRDTFEDAVHLAHGFIQERVPKLRTSMTNLKTGDTLDESAIEEAALSVRKRTRPAVNDTSAAVNDA